jgi:hypothetical protein
MIPVVQSNELMRGGFFGPAGDGWMKTSGPASRPLGAQHTNRGASSVPSVLQEET